MSEPSSSVPGEIADADVEAPDAPADGPEQVTLDVDEEKLEAWDDVKGDYQVEPDGQTVPNSMDTVDPTTAADGDGVDETAAAP
jgi:hypothetical protein